MSKKRKYFIFKDVKEVDDRVLRFVGSDNTLDRVGDVMTHTGWEIEEYKKNPVFLWAHQSREFPIGKTIKVEVDEKKGLLFDVEFATREIYPFADVAYKLYKNGFLKAVSVGFISLKEEFDSEHRVNYILEKELLELSAVPVPCNPNALEANMFKEAIEKEVINLQEYQELVIQSKKFVDKLEKDLIIDDNKESEEEPEKKEPEEKIPEKKEENKQQEKKTDNKIIKTVNNIYKKLFDDSSSVDKQPEKEKQLSTDEKELSNVLNKISQEVK